MISSQYLTHKHPAWQGCTLAELLTLASSILVVVIGLLTLLGIMIGKMSIIGMGALPLTFIGMRIAAPRYAKSKEGKPYGYLLVKLRLYLNDQSGGLLKGLCPYQRRIGIWSTERSMTKSHHRKTTQ